MFQSQIVFIFMLTTYKRRKRPTQQHQIKKVEEKCVLLFNWLVPAYALASSIVRAVARDVAGSLAIVAALAA